MIRMILFVAVSSSFTSPLGSLHRRAHGAYRGLCRMWFCGLQPGCLVVISFSEKVTLYMIYNIRLYNIYYIYKIYA